MSTGLAENWLRIMIRINYHLKGCMVEQKCKINVGSYLQIRELSDVTDETIREAFESLGRQDNVFRASPSLFPFLSSFL